ncbi:mast cell protease 3-like [Callospermophilus lateralis]|uniref:mast cell protease 3-like n=1 Tax=Callospermophilus lateralis TaxID=76772 RepID=UPI004053C764
MVTPPHSILPSLELIQSPFFSLWIHEHQGQVRTFLSGKIIGGREAMPHSHPYIAYLWINITEKTKKMNRSITVILGAHDIDEQEMTQQVIPIRKVIPHPYFKRKSFNDMLLQLEKKAKVTAEGDSGSPLVCKNVAQGIVSYGKIEGTLPNIYNRISSFLRWIKTTMKSFKLQGQD